jgi:tRNA pseudouridine-54 N-methylase
MSMRHFLVIFKDLPIERSSVKSGRISREVISACRCVNVGLFVSGDLRRDVIVSLGLGNEDNLRVISFPGFSLRRVSPDERSISFFLLKSIEKVVTMEQGNRFVMDNGIELICSSLSGLIESWKSDLILVPPSNPERFILDTILSADRMESDT